MDYNRILDNLYVGSCPRAPKDVRALGEAGVTSVLNLQTEEDEEHWQISWTALEEEYRACGIEVRRVPVRDFDVEDLGKKLPEAVRALKELLDAGHTVYLYCTAGVNRSPTVAIAYLASHLDFKLEDALYHVRRLHPSSPSIEAIEQAALRREL